MASRLKWLIRVLVGLFAAIFGSLYISVPLCKGSASSQMQWIHSLCGPDVWILWVTGLFLIFRLILFALDDRFKRFRRYAVAVLLAIYGLYGLRDPQWWYSGWLLVSIALLVAAFAVTIGSRWARYIVWSLAAAFVAMWGYSLWFAVRSGSFHNSSAVLVILSVVPGCALVLATAFCCYVMATDCRRGAIPVKTS